jgi:acyl-coenzyme A synthetase/AMP-(fatty) acid ligase
VNIYPQVIESRLVTHPKVLDAAVIGVPHPEMGEEVVAVIQPGEDVDAADALADDLRAFVRRELGGVMVPRRIMFHTAFPREPNGKIRKAKIREELLALNGAWGDSTWIAASARTP